jgi:hypothetical protein
MSAVHAWDEGVAFYTGSLEGVATGGNSNGVMPYRLAEKRCENFKTCGEKHDSTSGTSHVNIELFRQFGIGAHKILLGQCEAARPIVRKMVALMAIPLIQGTLRYAYKIDRLGLTGDKEKGEGAVFAASIVPRVAHCNADDAATIMNNMKVGAASTSFAAVKTAFENNYACMNITCPEVGGILDPSTSDYYNGAYPCLVTVINRVTNQETDEGIPAWGVVVIILVSLVTVGMILIVARMVWKARSQKDGEGFPSRQAWSTHSPVTEIPAKSIGTGTVVVVGSCMVSDV